MGKRGEGVNYLGHCNDLNHFFSQKGAPLNCLCCSVDPGLRTPLTALYSKVTLKAYIPHIYVSVHLQVVYTQHGSNPLCK